MQRSVRLSLSLTGAAALVLANSPMQPVAAQEEDGSAADLGVMEINLKDAVQFNWGFQGALHRSVVCNTSQSGCEGARCINRFRTIRMRIVAIRSGMRLQNHRDVKLIVAVGSGLRLQNDLSTLKRTPSLPIKAPALAGAC